MPLAATEPGDNDLAKSLYEQGTPRYTSDTLSDGRSRTRSPFLPEPPVKTAETANRPQTSLPTARPDVAGRNAGVRQGIDGVIAEIRTESIVIQCQLPGQLVEINLPPTLVPAELQAYGQTVSLSLDYSSGYQRPIVQRRAPSPHNRLAGETEADAWIDTL
jgi:hypothetical protein